MMCSLLIFAISLYPVVHSEKTDVSNFICSDGTETKFSRVCNGVEDCLDGSDEGKELCYHIICPQDKFRCYYGACVNKTVRCDGHIQCKDASDEYYCNTKSTKCGSDYFQCISGECIPQSKLCDKITHCSDQSDESVLKCHPIICPPNTYQCKSGECVQLDVCCDGYPDCIDRSDESELLCKTLKCPEKDCKKIYESVSCPPVVSKRMNVKCQSTLDYKKGWIPCNKPLPIGTIVRYECKPFFKPSDDYYSNNTYSMCQADGSWNKKHLECIPECGKINSIASPLIVHGWILEEGSLWPWHATLYTLQSGKWSFWCGGTLITENIILTAAHCTWRITPDTMQVALGKFSKDYNKTDDFSQFFNVKKIVIQPLYQDVLGNYGSDIAILILNETVEFSDFIIPACLDWNLDYIDEHLSDNGTGMVAGMGVTENDTFSDELRITYLSVVSDEKCIQAQSRDFKKYITYSSFCAGWTNGTGVCNGDSGGGLIFLKPSSNEQWILQGVVSVSPRRLGTSFCDPKHYTIFTKVGVFVKWIKNVIDKADAEEANADDEKHVIL